MLPGDFLAPSLLSSLDKGKGMMDMLNRVGGCGVQYVCFGNHETDIPVSDLRERIKEYKGKWINSNMRDFEPSLPEYDVIEVKAGGQTRRVGIIGLLTTDKNLYQKGAFGGAMETAAPVYETAARLRKKLMEEEGCDVVIPMTHQVMAEDREMARLQMGFPLLVAAHDHDPYVETIEGCTIVKTGMDAENAAIVDILWESGETPGERPKIKVELVRCDDYISNEELVEIAARHNRVVEELENAFLCVIPDSLRPFSSTGIRRSQTSVGTLITSLCRDALGCDAVAMDAGCIRRNFEYGSAEHFTYGDLKKEVPFDSEIFVVPIEGSVLQEIVKASRARSKYDPPQDWGGYLQIDDGMEWDDNNQELKTVHGEPFSLDKVYAVGLLELSIKGMNRNQPLIDWANTNADKIPHKEQLRPAKELVVKMCSEMIWEQLADWNSLDADNSGYIDRGEVRRKLTQVLGNENLPDIVIDNVMKVVDENNDGIIDSNEFSNFVRFFKQMNSFKLHSDSCSLRIIFVNDVYELKNLPQFDSVIREHQIPNTIVMLPGDFLAPSLLSSLDKGKGMMDMLNRVGGCGVQYVCFGNHETDIPVSDLRERIKEYKGKWINSNMRDFEPSLPEYDVIEVKAGGQTRRVGIIGLLTTDKNLYQKGAFGGAMETAAPVYETAARLRKKLMEEEGCDVVIPMTHQVMAEDREMARLQMGFPLLVAAHDHDPYVETIEGCTIVKTGMDAENAAIVDILWESGETPGERPKIKVELVKCSEYHANQELVKIMQEHNRPLEEIESAYLCEIDVSLSLKSTQIRRSQTSVGTLLTSLVRDGLRQTAGHKEACDGVIIDAGAIRRNFEYPEGYSVFTWGDLKKEIPFSSEIVVVSIPGKVLADAIQFSRKRAYFDVPEDWGGFMQLDNGFMWDEETRSVTHVNAQPLDPNKEYNIGILVLSLQGMNKNQPLMDWCNANPKLDFVFDEAGRPAKDIIIDCCAKIILSQLGAFHDLDLDADGQLSPEEVKTAMQMRLKRSVSEKEVTNLMKMIDVNSDGFISRDEFERAIATMK